MGKGVWGGGEIIYLPLPLHCHHQNDSFIKMGSDENHFNVSLIVRDKVTRQCPQTTTFEGKGEPKQSVEPLLPVMLARFSTGQCGVVGQARNFNTFFGYLLGPAKIGSELVLMKPGMNS